MRSCPTCFLDCSKSSHHCRVCKLPSHAIEECNFLKNPVEEYGSEVLCENCFKTQNSLLPKNLEPITTLRVRLHHHDADAAIVTSGMYFWLRRLHRPHHDDEDAQITPKRPNHHDLDVPKRQSVRIIMTWTFLNAVKLIDCETEK